MSATHGSVRLAWVAMWSEMRGLGLLEADVAAGDEASIRDIIVFVSMFKRIRRGGQHKVGSLAARLLHDLCYALVSWLSVHFDKFVLEVFVPNNDCHRPPPALRAHGTIRNKCAVSADAAWQVIDQSKAAGLSLYGAIKFKSDDDTLGCHPRAAYRWTCKLLQMYDQRVSLGFRNVKHYNIVSDGATHSCHDTLVSVGYTWENDLAGFLASQCIPPGKDITWFDQSNMPAEIAILAAKRKLERVAAFRQMQAISNQIHCLTDGVLNIDSFKLDESVHLDEVQPGEVRIVRPGNAGMTDVAMVVRSDRSTQQVLPKGFEESLLLVVALDQGAIGVAGIAYGINKMKLMLAVKFDKFHRAIRDVKLSLKHCCSGIFLKTQLYRRMCTGLTTNRSALAVSRN